MIDGSFFNLARNAAETISSASGSFDGVSSSPESEASRSRITILSFSGSNHEDDFIWISGEGGLRSSVDDEDETLAPRLGGVDCSTDAGDEAEVGASDSAARLVSMGLCRRLLTKSYCASDDVRSSWVSRFLFVWAIAVSVMVESGGEGHVTLCGGCLVLRSRGCITHL